MIPFETTFEQWVGRLESLCAARAAADVRALVRVSELKRRLALPETEFGGLLLRMAHNGIVYLFSDEPRPGGEPERREAVRLPQMGPVHYLVWLGRRAMRPARDD